MSLGTNCRLGRIVAWDELSLMTKCRSGRIAAFWKLGRIVAFWNLGRFVAWVELSPDRLSISTLHPPMKLKAGSNLSSRLCCKLSSHMSSKYWYLPVTSLARESVLQQLRMWVMPSRSSSWSFWASCRAPRYMLSRMRDASQLRKAISSSLQLTNVNLLLLIRGTPWVQCRGYCLRKLSKPPVTPQRVIRGSFSNLKKKLFLSITVHSSEL